MPSITTWNRVEPAPRPADVSAGLQVRTHDPLWLLGRQWQVQEFAGQDAGSPVRAALSADVFELTHYFGAGVPPDGIANGTPLNNRTTPIESLAEREPRSASSWRLSADTGRHFERLLRQQGAAAHVTPYRAVFPLTEGPLTGRVVNGDSLAHAMAAALRPDSGAPSLPAQPAVPAADRARVIAASTEWLAWLDRLLTQAPAGGSAWRNDRLEYEFCVGAATTDREIVLTAQDYGGGHLDWYDFTIRHGATLGGRPFEARARTVSQTLIPAPVTFPGMPASRWWELENASVDLTGLHAGPEDLIRVLLAEFALIYGNDWFLVPLELPVGTLSRVRSLSVTDSFGDTFQIQPFSKAGGAATSWRMFAVTEEGRLPPPSTGGDLFFLPPALGPSIAGSTDEEVVLLRDEMANVVWAVEKVIDGAIQSTTQASTVHDVAEGERYRYRLASDVQEHWIPFIPVQGPRSTVMLRRARMLDPAGRPVGPSGRILSSPGPLLIHEEEVPREGITVRRAFQFARWTDGSSHLWATRQKQLVARESSGVLRFDLAIPER